MQKSNRELFESFDVVDTTWRKWSREFLPPDPEAGLRRGKTRMYSPEEAFKVWAGGRLLNEKQMTYEEAKEAIGVLWDFMHIQGLLPLDSAISKMMIGTKKDKYSRLIWEFFITRTVSGNIYRAKGISDRIGTEFEASGIIYKEISEKYLLAELSPEHKTTGEICTVSFNLLNWLSDFSRLSGFKIS